MNPVLKLELRQSWPKDRIPLLLANVAALLAVAAWTGHDGSSRSLGVTVYQALFSIGYFGVTILGASVGAGLVASEVAGRTWDALLLSGLSPREIARGKLVAALLRVTLYVAALAPLGAAGPLLEGATFTEILCANVFLLLVAAVAVTFGLAVGSSAHARGTGVLLAIAGAAVAAPTLYLTVGLGLSFVAHARWREVPRGLPIWFPAALAGAPFDATDFALLVWSPALAVALAIWFFYEVAVSQLAIPGEDRSAGLRRWYVTTLALVTSSAGGFCLLTAEGRTPDGLVAGLSSIFAFVFFSVLVFAGESIARLIRTSMLVMVSGLLALSSFSLFGAGLLYGGDGSLLPSARAVGILVCGEYWSAYLVFAVGLVSWVRARTRSVLTARTVPSLVCAIVAGGPWVGLFVARLTERRLDDALPLLAPSPFYAFEVMKALELGEARIALPSAIICSIGWILMGFSLLGLARRRTRATERNVSPPPRATKSTMRLRSSAAG